LNNYLNFIYYKSLDLGVDGLNEIFEISEGLNNKIYSNLFKYNDIDEFIMSLKSKRYTYSKLRRILLNILLGITKNDITNFMNKSYINNNYVKVLAFNDVGRRIIKHAKLKDIQVINRYSDYKKYNVPLDRFMLTDKTTNIYYLPFVSRNIKEEYTKNAVYVSK
jgi:predicted nucleotidyltransferase